MLSDFLRFIKRFILVIGPKNAGKTSILTRLTTGEFNPTEPTLGYSEEQVAKVRVIEIGGQESYREYWEIAVQQDPARIFFVVDITREDEFNEFIAFCEFIESSYPNLAKKTILIANKSDLVAEIPDYISNIEQHAVCSAKNGRGMLDILEAIAGLQQEAGVADEKSPSEESKHDESFKDEEQEEKEIKTILDEFRNKF
ncbi:MAG: ADP-ribosylation factor-like protein [Candidatus Odinarchaeota archaeon]